MKAIFLKTARERAGLTQLELQAKSGVPQAVISKLERVETARPYFETVVHLADALDVDPRRLRFGQPPESLAS